jgi:hypothetical protein
MEVQSAAYVHNASAKIGQSGGYNDVAVLKVWCGSALCDFAGSF